MVTKCSDIDIVVHILFYYIKYSIITNVETESNEKEDWKDIESLLHDKESE